MIGLCLQPVYGFAGNQDRAKFIKATGHSDLYFVQDPEVPLDAVSLMHAASHHGWNAAALQQAYHDWHADDPTMAQDACY